MVGMARHLGAEVIPRSFMPILHHGNAVDDGQVRSNLLNRTGVEGHGETVTPARMGGNRGAGGPPYWLVSAPSVPT